jgi:hypothetical protein
MRQLRVLLIHRHNDNYRRLTGWWSYPVPEFLWDERSVDQIGFNLDLGGGEAGHYDLAVLDDWTFGSVNHPTMPLAYVVVDSARSDVQLHRNLKQAEQADLVLVDSDELSKFSRRKARRFAYAVNETLFYPRPKEYDVAFLCWPTPERRVIQMVCQEICDRRGWKFLTGTYEKAEDYARAIGSAKIVVHKAHVEQARSWRVFDVMASRGCLLTSHLPSVSDDGIVAGVHYHEYKSVYDLEPIIDNLLDGNTWESAARNGYGHIIAYHTWRARAMQFRQILAEAFKWV